MKETNVLNVQIIFYNRKDCIFKFWRERFWYYLFFSLMQFLYLFKALKTFQANLWKKEKEEEDSY